MRHYKDIRYSLKQSNRKTMSIYLERNGEITVLAPVKMSIEDIEKVIEQKRYRLYLQLEEWKELNRNKANREFVNGEGFLYLGRSYRLRIVNKQDIPLKLYQGYFNLRKRDLSRAEELFKELYREKGQRRISERVEHYSRMMGVNPKGIRVLELKNRWASCSTSGVINFHWKCIMAPLTVIDYIVVHELAHMVYPNHTQSFWNLVDKVLPDYLDRKNWLREKGAGLDL